MQGQHGDARCQYDGSDNDQKSFDDELDLQLRFTAAQNFPYADFLCTVNGLRGGEVDKVYAGNEQYKRSDEPQHIQQLVTDGYIAVITYLRVIMHRA